MRKILNRDEIFDKLMMDDDLAIYQLFELIRLDEKSIFFTDDFSSRATVFSNFSRVGLSKGVFLQKNKYNKFFAITKIVLTITRGVIIIVTISGEMIFET